MADKVGGSVSNFVFILPSIAAKRFGQSLWDDSGAHVG